MKSLSGFRIVLILLVAVTGLTTGHGPARAEDPASEARQRRRPREFFSVFNFGYGGDDFPEDPALFETIVATLGREGGFNAILCSWSDERAAICRKHGMRIMVDLLNGRHHVYDTPTEAEALLERLRDDDVVMGYHLWSDKIGGRGAGRIRDIRNCNAWDPTHPAYSATYKTGDLEAVAHADIFGWYDFHWKRAGWNSHFHMLQTALPLARKNDAVFYSLLSTDSGLPGKGNYNRSLWSLNQGVAFGMKGVLWFIGLRQMNKATGEWTEAGRDINRVNAQIMPLKGELVRLGNPVAVYATPITRDANDREVVGGPSMLPELAGNAFPPDFWMQPTAGEFTMGVFVDDEKRDAVYVANLNAYAPQRVTLKLGRVASPRLFDRRTRAWRDLPLADGTMSLELGPGEGELVRFE